MAGHFDAVGFAASDLKEVESLIETALERAGESGDTVEHPDGRALRYEDPSGAAITIHVDRDGEFECSQPGFAGESRFRWRPLHVVRDPQGCRFCDLVYAELLDDEGEEYYPFLLKIETMGAARALIPYGEPADVRFAGLWEHGEVWPDEAAFGREQEAEWADVSLPEIPDFELPPVRGFAARSLVPSGTFGLDDGGAMSPHVIAHGVVVSVEERRNELRGASFLFVRLDTLGGVFETCAAPGILEREHLLAPGAVVGGTLWLVGRPLTLREEPGPVPVAEEEAGTRSRGLLGRLFGR